MVGNEEECMCLSGKAGEKEVAALVSIVEKAQISLT